MSPRVIAAAIPQVAATIRSPITRCSVGCSRGTPVIVSVGVPAPSIWAPIWLSIVAQVDDLRLARRVVDRGDALGEDRGHQDVLGGTHRRELQLDLRAAQLSRRSATTQPCSMLQSAPSCRRPDWCMSSGRDPIASPPGSATRARLHRPTSGPSTHTDARNWRTAAKSASYLGSSGEVIRTTSTVEFDVGAETAQHLGHQRHVEDVRAVGDRRGALGQQTSRPSASARCSWRPRQRLRRTTGCRRSPRNARPRPISLVEPVAVHRAVTRPVPFHPWQCT